MLLHEHSNFKDLIVVVSGEMGIDPTLVEKDYWIMHCLWGLKQQGFTFELKGGTSLSKGFGLIHRFSEDIDIRIEPPLGMDVKIRKNQNKEAHIKSRSDYYEWVASNLRISGIQNVERDYAFDDQDKMRSGGVRLNYVSNLSTLSGMKDGVLLELGFDDTAPNQAVNISSWAFDYATKYVKEIEDNRANNVLCYLPEYTFVEKLQTISTKYHQYKKGNGFPKNFLRHYYDVYCLLEYRPVLDFINTDQYQMRKQERFPKSDIQIIAQNPAFSLKNENERSLFASEYQKVSSLYYKGQPSFDDILNKLSKYLKVL